METSELQSLTVKELQKFASDLGAEEALRSMSLRYKGPELGPPYVDRILETRGHFVLITIRLDRVIGWTED